jgi:adenosylcobinamide-phosphate synthase
MGCLSMPSWLSSGDGWKILLLPIASLLDYLIGDPWGWPHPVQVIGWGISAYSQFTLKWVGNPKIRRFAGVGLGIGTIAGTGLISGLLLWAAYQLHPGFGFTLEIILLASCFAGRSLRAAAEDVLSPLSQGDLDQSRQKLSLYVGRDTENLSQAEIMRAILETVSENAVDGVMAPLFYAIAGSFIPGVGPVPLTLAYKAASTLDSMVGYRAEPYKDIGWFSAKVEDFLTWLPCRLTVLTIGLISGNLVSIWQQCQADATKDPSPNAGWSECAYAVTLGVQLGGMNSYRGVIKQKPLLGQPIHQCDRDKIQQGLQLTRCSFLTWLTLGAIGQIACILGVH